MIRAFIFTAVSILFVSAASAQPTIPASAPAAPQPSLSRSYLLGPGDVVSVKVLGEKDWDFTTAVDEDGKITVPYDEVGIPAKCRTQQDVRADIKKYLSKFINEPMVDVNVTDKRSRPPVTVIGEVRTPHEVTLTRRAWLTTLLALSQGPTDHAGGVVQIFRTTTPVCDDDLRNNWKIESGLSGDVPFRLFSLNALQKGGDANPEILPGDVIYVWKALPVFVTGQVVEPRTLALTELGLTLQGAIAQVGGLRTEAQKKDIKISRLRTPGVLDGPRDEVSLNLLKDPQAKNYKLQPYDMIIVDQAKDSIGMMLLKFAIGVGKTTALAAGTSGGYRISY